MNAWKWMLAIICFNIGVGIIGTISSLSGGTYYLAIANSWNIYNLTLLPFIAGFAGAVGLAAVGTIFLNYDPIKLAGIGGFTTLMITNLWNSGNLLSQIAKGNVMMNLFVAIFMGFLAMITLVFVYQLATQGFKSME